MFRPGGASEVVIDPQLATAYGLHPGSGLRLLAAPTGAGNRPDFSQAAQLRFRVAGVVVFGNQIVPVTPSDHFPEIALTPGFYRSRQGGSFPVANEEELVQLRPGTNLGNFARRASELARHYPGTHGVQVIDLADQQVKVEQAIRPQADALGLFAALAGLAVLAVIGQLLGRQLMIGASDYPVLRALGTGRWQPFWLAVLRAGAVSAAGAGVAVVIAVAASPLMPIGPARLAEPDPGVQVNLAILGIGLLAVAALPVLVIAPGRLACRPGWQQAGCWAASAGCAVAAGRSAGRPGRGACRGDRGPDGRRAGAGPQRAAGAQCADRDDGRGRRRGGRAGLWGQLGPAG